jgi:hypothetical protein
MLVIFASRFLPQAANEMTSIATEGRPASRATAACNATTTWPSGRRCLPHADLVAMVRGVFRKTHATNALPSSEGERGNRSRLASQRAADGEIVRPGAKREPAVLLSGK